MSHESLYDNNLVLAWLHIGGSHCGGDPVVFCRFGCGPITASQPLGPVPTGQRSSHGFAVGVCVRDRTGNAPVALQRQLDFQGMEVVSDRLALLVQDETDGVTEWRIDPHVRPVELIEAISRDGIDVRLDGELIDAEGEPVAHRPGEDRPDILVLLRQEDLQLTAMIRLSPWSIAPSRDGRAEAMDEIDLDGLGRSEVDW